MSNPVKYYGGTGNAESLTRPPGPVNGSSTASRVQHLRETHSRSASSTSIHKDRLRPHSPAPSGSGVWSDDETEEDEEATPLVYEIEPGINPNVEDFSDLYNKEHLGIIVADWSADKAKVRQDMSNDKFIRWLDRPRPSWSRARWISMNGLHWDVFKAMALKYELQ